MKLSKGNERATIFKRLAMLLGAVLLVFALINAVWFLGYMQRYNRLAAHLDVTYIDDPEEGHKRKYSREVGEYTIILDKPSYLSDGGFVAISRTRGYVTTLDENNNIVGGDDILISLYLWPRFISGNRIGLDFFDDLISLWTQTEVTSDLEPVNSENVDDEYIDRMKQLISENYDEIITLINVLEETLEIDFTDVNNAD